MKNDLACKVLKVLLLRDEKRLHVCKSSRYCSLTATAAAVGNENVDLDLFVGGVKETIWVVSCRYLPIATSTSSSLTLSRRCMRALASAMRMTLSMWRTAIGTPPDAALSLLKSAYRRATCETNGTLHGSALVSSGTRPKTTFKAPLPRSNACVASATTA